MADEARIRQLLEDVLESGRSPEEVCAAAPGLLAEVRGRLERLRRVKRQIEAVFPSPETVVPGPPAVADRSDGDRNLAGGSNSAARYPLGEEIARGGMGVVHRATGTVLGRQVAVKLLQERYTPASDTARRFADEARITGPLRHPNIPAVHDLGVLPDGRPFLAMKLIKGDTLEDLLNRRADLAEGRGRFVAAFEQVCQAVAYAHAHDVIQRDLKPANVMVRAFGEVQVMDWGVAKVIGSRPAERADPKETGAPTTVLSLRESDDEFTHAGSVLGTPAYMAPEQAAGAVGTIDRRSDVVGLGAVLDMWKAFRASTGKPGHTPQAGILYDKFHVLKHLNEALDQVRKSEYTRLSGTDRRFIKGQKYTLLSRWANLSQEGRQSLKQLFAADRRLNKAYLLKEMFGQLWDYHKEGWARRFFDKWKAALRWQRLKPYEKFARMVESHWDGIALYCQEENKVALGFVEGFNNKVRVLQRRAYGLRDEEYLRLKVLTCMLPEI